MARTFTEGDQVMTKEGKAEVMHYLPRTFVVVVQLEKTGHIQSMPGFEVEKIKEDV